MDTKELSFAPTETTKPGEILPDGARKQLEELMKPRKIEEHTVKGGNWDEKQQSYVVKGTDGVITEYKQDSRKHEGQNVFTEHNYRIITDQNGETHRLPVVKGKDGQWKEKGVLDYAADIFKGPDRTGVISKTTENGVTTVDIKLSKYSHRIDLKPPKPIEPLS